MEPTPSEPLSGQDLSFWWADQPRQRTTMAMLLLLDRPPDPEQLRAAAQRAVATEPRLRQCVVEAPFDLARPRWENDPTFDLEFHIRRYAVTAEDGNPLHATLADLFRTIGPIYERPFDRTRPLWEMIEFDGPGDGAAIFFRLHHAVADGVGGNAILAALTDAQRESDAPPAPHDPPGAWDETGFGTRLREAFQRRRAERAERVRAIGRAAWQALTHPATLSTGVAIVRSLIEDARYESQSPLKHFGRSRHLTGIELPFQPLREARDLLGGQMIDVLLTAVAMAVGAWHDATGMKHVSELMTLVPINLRPRDGDGQGMNAGTGNRATGITVRLPIRASDPVELFRKIHELVQERKQHPAVENLPAMAEALAALPRGLYRSLAPLSSSGINLIVTNVPGIMQPRYLAGAEVTAGYPFAPVAPRCPVSVALYGYRDQLFVGLDADGTSMPDLEAFRELLRESFAEVIDAARKLRT